MRAARLIFGAGLGGLVGCLLLSGCYSYAAVIRVASRDLENLESSRHEARILTLVATVALTHGLGSSGTFGANRSLSAVDPYYTHKIMGDYGRSLSPDGTPSRVTVYIDRNKKNGSVRVLIRDQDSMKQTEFISKLLEDLLTVLSKEFGEDRVWVERRYDMPPFL